MINFFKQVAVASESPQPFASPPDTTTYTEYIQQKKGIVLDLEITPEDTMRLTQESRDALKTLKLNQTISQAQLVAIMRSINSNTIDTSLHASPVLVVTLLHCGCTFEGRSTLLSDKHSSTNTLENFVKNQGRTFIELLSIKEFRDYVAGAAGELVDVVIAHQNPEVLTTWMNHPQLAEAFLLLNTTVTPFQKLVQEKELPVVLEVLDKLRKDFGDMRIREMLNTPDSKGKTVLVYAFEQMPTAAFHTLLSRLLELDVDTNKTFTGKRPEKPSECKISFITLIVDHSDSTAMNLLLSHYSKKGQLLALLGTPCEGTGGTTILVCIMKTAFRPTLRLALELLESERASEHDMTTLWTTPCTVEYKAGQGAQTLTTSLSALSFALVFGCPGVCISLSNLFPPESAFFDTALVEYVSGGETPMSVPSFAASSPVVLDPQEAKAIFGRCKTVDSAGQIIGITNNPSKTLLQAMVEKYSTLTRPGYEKMKMDCVTSISWLIEKIVFEIREKHLESPDKGLGALKILVAGWNDQVVSVNALTNVLSVIQFEGDFQAIRSYLQKQGILTTSH